MSGEKAMAAGETLLLQLQRLVTRAGAATGGRKQLMALVDDVQTARRSLLRECAEIEAEMTRATTRAAAIGAYLRRANAGPGRHN